MPNNMKRSHEFTPFPENPPKRPCIKSPQPPSENDPTKALPSTGSQSLTFTSIRSAIDAPTPSIEYLIKRWHELKQKYNQDKYNQDIDVYEAPRSRPSTSFHDSLAEASSLPDFLLVDEGVELF